MKFYSYSNENGNYTKAINIENVSEISINDGYGNSLIRFYVAIHHSNGITENFSFLYEDEAKRLYNNILDVLNKTE